MLSFRPFPRTRVRRGKSYRLFGFLLQNHVTPGPSPPYKIREGLTHGVTTRNDKGLASKEDFCQVNEQEQEVNCMKLRTVWLAGVVLALGGWLNAATAKEGQEFRVPADTKFVLRLDLQAFRQTAFGERLFEMIRRKAVAELSKHAKGDKTDILEKVNEMLGFDPFEEIRGITIAASDYKQPEKSLVAMIQMGESTGNLEGLLLGLPGYSTEEYGKHQIYSATPDKHQTIFGSIFTDKSGQKTVMLATRREAVVGLLDQLDDRVRDQGDYQTVTVDTEGSEILYLRILQLPAEMLDEGPPANVAKIVEGVTLRVGDAEGDLKAHMSLTAKTESQADQLRQMTQGLIAMLDLAQTADPDDEDLRKIKRFVNELTSDREGREVDVRLTVSSEELAKVLEHELKDD